LERGGVRKKRLGEKRAHYSRAEKKCEGSQRFMGFRSVETTRSEVEDEEKRTKKTGRLETRERRGGSCEQLDARVRREKKIGGR